MGGGIWSNMRLEEAQSLMYKDQSDEMQCKDQSDEMQCKELNWITLYPAKRKFAIKKIKKRNSSLWNEKKKQLGF